MQVFRPAFFTGQTKCRSCRGKRALRNKIGKIKEDREESQTERQKQRASEKKERKDGEDESAPWSMKAFPSFIPLPADHESNRGPEGRGDEEDIVDSVEHKWEAGC
ncbi:hypothetical protein K435DRAFT_877676 [Dendrothele bispora CBS 962.96]|uniref:Uncharacterized protein n=1 Tax=Dendrothele bispora (strain CBS 962.96) TaxID=1314807 RepID=A0A4S8KPR0_DENBC|nr:hypothetical protein K435DRAFT_877676 [Dendrothele bispora CBS 962.96]